MKKLIQKWLGIRPYNNYATPYEAQIELEKMRMYIYEHGLQHSTKGNCALSDEVRSLGVSWYTDVWRIIVEKKQARDSGQIH